MPVATLGEALPYVGWVVLTALGVGSFAFVAITGQVTDATSGYLRFAALMAAVFGALALAADPALPLASVLAIKPASADADTFRRLALALFTALALVYAVALGRPRARALSALGGVAAGVAVLGAAAVGWAPTLTDAVPFGVQLVVLSAVTGGAAVAVALGHWYLVTPKLLVGPLVLQVRMLLAGLAIQALLFVIWTTLGGGVDQQAWEALAGPSAIVAWLRGLITVAFPLVLAYMALRTAQTRSMESATGLLYINLAAVLAGTIGAAALYVSSGILV